MEGLPHHGMAMDSLRGDVVLGGVSWIPFARDEELHPEQIWMKRTFCNSLALS
jgi:hypothetical protein